MAIKEFNVDLDVKGRVLASTVPNSTGSIVTWNTTTNVFGLRTNTQIISDLNLSSNFITSNTAQTGLTGNKTSNGIWTLGQVRKAGQSDTQMLLAGGGHRPVSDFALKAHTHTFASLTSKPTTISGYGITDFNSLGDARWALRTRTITAGTGLIGGGSLVSNRTLNFDTNWGDNRYVKKSGDTMTGNLTIEPLAGTGTRMVTANASGTLGTQAIPTGNATHTGDVTGSTALTIANDAVTTAKIANDAVTHAKYQNIDTKRILGRGATGNGNVQELTLGSNLSLSTSGVLNASYLTGTLALLNEGENTTNRVWGAKPIADYVKQYAGENLGLQGVTDIGNWTTNDIEVRLNNTSSPNDLILMPAGSSSNPAGNAPLISTGDKGFRISALRSPYLGTMAGAIGTRMGMYFPGIPRIGRSAVAFSLGDSVSWGYSYMYNTDGSIGNGTKAMTIELDYTKHHTERLSKGNGQELQFPPENGTLATREWVTSPNNESPSTDPGVGLIRNGEIARYIFRDNFTINHSTRIIDAVDTTYSRGNGITLTGTTFSQVLTTSGSGTYVQSLTRTAGGIQANLGTPPNATYSQATLAQLKAGTNATNRLINPSDFKEAVEDITTPKQIVITATRAANDDSGKTIIFNSTNASVGIGSSTTTPSGFEVYLVNNTSTDRNVWGASGLRYKINDGSYLTAGTAIKLKGNGVGTLIRIGSTDGVLALGDFTT